MTLEWAELLEAYSAAVSQRAGDGGVLGDVAHGICFGHVDMGAIFDEGVEADSSSSEAFGAGEEDTAERDSQVEETWQSSRWYGIVRPHISQSLDIANGVYSS